MQQRSNKSFNGCNIYSSYCWDYDLLGEICISDMELRGGSPDFRLTAICNGITPNVVSH